MNDISRNRKWNALLRVAAFGAALMGMYISARFSVNGFQFSTENPSWVGWSIALIIIVLESVWQKFGKNRTLFAIALVCYSYGIITNVVGIAQAKGGYSVMDFLDYLVAIVFGTLFEVFPEPLLAWSISGDISSDPLGRFVDGLDDAPQKPGKDFRQQPQNNQHQGQQFRNPNFVGGGGKPNQGFRPNSPVYNQIPKGQDQKKKPAPKTTPNDDFLMKFFEK